MKPTNPVTEPFRRAIQVGVVVRDLEQSMAALTGVFGIGPFRVVECPAPGRENQQSYYGEPCRYRTRQAFADLGTVELELIQPLEGKTIWTDFLAERGPGIHHIRFNVPDEAALSAYLKTQGIGKTQEGAGIREGSYWANYDTEKLVGFIVEILQPAPGSDGLTTGVTRQQKTMNLEPAVELSLVGRDRRARRRFGLKCGPRRARRSRPTVNPTGESWRLVQYVRNVRHIPCVHGNYGT